jgi:HEPN domain-containing protein
MSGQQPLKPVETPAEWRRYADESLAVAEREMAYDRPAFHTVCFLCQSAAERCLKGYLIAQGWMLEKTHDIVVLLGFCQEYDEVFADLLEDGDVLNRYITAGRYPGNLAFEAIGRAEAEEAVRIVRKIEALVAERLTW